VQDYGVPETEKSAKEELADKNDEVLQNDEDEVLHRDDAAVSQLTVIHRDVYPG
jgi:hypothetical protein